MELYEQPMLLMGIKKSNHAHLEPEAFFENVDDIINEEEFEESIINQSIHKKLPTQFTEELHSINKLNKDLKSKSKPSLLPAVKN